MCSWGLAVGDVLESGRRGGYSWDPQEGGVYEGRPICGGPQQVGGTCVHVCVSVCVPCVSGRGVRPSGVSRGCASVSFVPVLCVCVLCVCVGFKTSGLASFPRPPLQGAQVPVLGCPGAGGSELQPEPLPRGH